MKHIFILLIFFTGIGCTSNNPKQNKLTNTGDTTNTKDSTITTKVVDKKEDIVTDTSILISQNTVVFLLPDSLEIQKMQKEYSEDDYNEIIADMTWYLYLAMEDLDSLHVRNLQSDKEYILLQGVDGKLTTIKRKETEGNMIVFNVNKPPLISYNIMYNRDSILRFLNEK